MAEWIEANGVSLRYELRARGGRPVLVLLHEIGGAIESWDDCIETLAEHFDLLRYDQRGFGLSEKADTLSIEQIVQDLLALLDVLGIKAPCHLAGAAMGAGIAIAFAQQHPERTAALVVASPALGYPPGAPLRVLEERAERVVREGMRATTDPGFENSYPVAIRGPEFARYRLRWLGNDPQGLAAISRVASRMHLLPALGDIRCPTLVLGCTHDSIRPAAKSEEIAALIPGARFRTIAAGHFSAVQAPAAFTQAAVGFLRSL